MTDQTPEHQWPPRGFDLPETLSAERRQEAGVLVYRDVEVAGPAGFRPLRMDVQVPADVPGPVPVVVYVHGGAFRYGSRRASRVTAPIFAALLRRGIAVAAVEYRMSGEALFPACVHDVKAAVRWLRRFGAAVGVRPDAIGAWGDSAGGHLALFLVLNGTDPQINGTQGVTDVSADVQAGVAWYPPTEFLTMDAQALPDAGPPHDAPDSPESLLIGGAIQEHPQAAAFASPIAHVRDRTAPVLLVHGLLDDVVPPGQSEVMAAALQRAGADVRLELVPGAGHVLDGIDPAPVIATSVDFLAERLGAG